MEKMTAEEVLREAKLARSMFLSLISYYVIPIGGILLLLAYLFSPALDNPIGRIGIGCVVLAEIAAMTIIAVVTIKLGKLKSSPSS